MQVTTKTLSKSFFDQLVSCRATEFDAMPYIHGWVKASDKSAQTFIITREDGKLAKMNWLEVYDLWRYLNREELGRKGVAEVNALFHKKFAEKYDQIFI